MDTNSQPVTERSNPLSTNIDIQSPVDIVSTLQACDEEIFNGWQEFPGLFDGRIQENLSQVVKIATSILKDASNSAIMFSGCGTSGRLGFIIARSLNDYLRRQGMTACYHSIMAGGDKALFTSQEAFEDDPMLGAQVLKEAVKDKPRVLFFGITCGLSSPFVAGQLDYCLKHLDRFTPVLVGFNPVHLARNMPIEKWNQTFLQVAQNLQEAETKGQGFILNPVVGPEPITGSSRMKSGTATKLLLETVLVAAHSACFFNTNISVKELLLQYKCVWQRVYQEKSDIGALLHEAGISLKQGGSLYYVGKGSLGILGLIDASECPPTYGATFDDVRGFLEGGYQTLDNSDGELSALGKHFQISCQHFHQTIVPTLSERDLVIFISQDEISSLSPEMRTASCKKACVVVNTKQASVAERESAFDIKARIDLKQLVSLSLTKELTKVSADLQSMVMGFYAELAVKWTLNAVSTGAHIMKGKVFNNTMIDLKPSNVKLFHRAIGIIQQYSKLQEEHCREYLLRSLYNTDCVTEEMRRAPIAQHIEIAVYQSAVVPTALQAALQGSTIQQARSAVEQQPLLRQAILNTLSTHRPHKS